MVLHDEKKAFTKRLTEALKKAKLDISSPTRLAREFNLRYHGVPVTTQAFRKWLEGKALPSQDKLRVMALWLNVSPQWLRFGEAEMDNGRRNQVIQQELKAYKPDQQLLLEKFRLLNEHHRRLTLEIIQSLLKAEGKKLI
jgi:hypothetical protein